MRDLTNEGVVTNREIWLTGNRDCHNAGRLFRPGKTWCRGQLPVIHDTATKRDAESDPEPDADPDH
jgi:hypothetical protein